MFVMNKLLPLLVLSLLATSGHRLQAAAEPVTVRAELVAVVNDRVILGSDILGRMSATAEALRLQYPDNPALFAQKWQEQVQRVLEDLINEELILGEAIAAGRQVSEEHLDEYLKSFIQTNYGGNSDLFVQALAAEGRTVDEFRERHGQSDLVAAAKRKKVESLPPLTPEQIEQYYHAHEQDFWAKESVKLGIIVINQDPTNGPAAVEAQRKEAAAMHARLVSGADFATEAKLHSQGRSAPQGGDWGWIERSILRKELDVVALSLKPGGLSEVIETKEAWYIMRVTDHRSGALKPLADVREDIREILQTQARSAVIKQWHGQLRAKAFLRYFGGLAADSVSWENRLVKIEVKHIGVSTLSDAQIESHLHLKAGEAVTLASVDRDLRNLYSTGDFYNIRVSEAAVDGGSKLIYFVQEKPVLDDIQFAGNKNISRQELLPKLVSKTRERLDEWKLFKDALAIQSLYQEAGYPKATVKYVPNINEQTGHGSVTFEVTEGLATDAADAVAPTNRLTVAMLAFADKTGEPESAHWRYSLPRLVASPLGEVKAIRIYPAEASEYGLRQLKLKAGEPIDAAQARRIGEVIEARRVVWGDYRRQGKTWTATAQVLNVASGKQSAELSATADDWFEVCDQLAEKILQELALQPTEAERARMKMRFTASPAALEFFSQFYALQTERKPFAELERCARQAVTADPRCAKMHLALATCWFSQGKLEEGTQEIQEALKLKPELANAHMALGLAMLFQDKPEVAANESREAIRLDPDGPDGHIRLAEYLVTRGEWRQAVSSLQAAQRLNPVSANVRAHLGRVYAGQGERTKALHELEAAEFFGLEDVNAEEMTARAYDELHEIPLAVEHHEKFLTLARAGSKSQGGDAVCRTLAAIERLADAGLCQRRRAEVLFRAIVARGPEPSALGGRTGAGQFPPDQHARNETLGGRVDPGGDERFSKSPRPLQGAGPPSRRGAGREPNCAGNLCQLAETADVLSLPGIRAFVRGAGPRRRAEGVLGLRGPGLPRPNRAPRLRGSFA